MGAVIQKYAIMAGGYLVAAVFLWLFIGAKSDIKAEIERCNVEKLAAVQDASEALREAQIASYEARIVELGQIAANEATARQIAQKAAIEAQNRPERVREVIRNVTNPEDCLNQSVSDDILSLLD